MEVIKIGERIWHKFKGDEGQDVYVAQFIDNAEELLGKYADESSYDILVDSDADFYLPQGLTDTEELTESRVAFKFRKNVFTKEEQEGAFEGLFDAAKESNNRGLAAGPREESQGTRDWVTSFQYDILKYFIDGQPKSVDGTNQIDEIKRNNQVEKHEIRGGVWLRTKVEEEFGDYKNFFPKCLSALENMSVEGAVEYATKIRKSFISDTNYATAIWSGIAGFYGRYPRIPYGRATAYTDHNREIFEKCYPFARKLEKEFARMLPERHLAQKEFADRLDNRFLIGEDTTFTTITVNSTSADRNARMACHKDAGSLNAGFSNLTVITKEGKNWKGGYLVAPEVRAAINVRPGDLLLIDNMRVIHGNTPIEAPDSGVEDFLRMSLVFYFREDMDKLGSWEYEKLRRQFVDDRKVNQSHELWRPFWNGVSPSMWDQQEWYDYLEERGGREMVEKYHPEAYKVVNSLEAFF
tara:strand:- start:896 stop:2296 length:1401 start_codon:yes stop_codon:yes gene_type:complete